MIEQIGQLCCAVESLELDILESRSQALPEERMDTRGSGPGYCGLSGLRRVESVALTLKWVGGERESMANVPLVDGLPVDGPAGKVQHSQTFQDHVPIVVLFLDGREPCGLHLGQALLPHTKQRITRTNFHK